MNKIIIIGAGGFGREVKFLIDRINQQEMTFDILGFVDDNTDLDKTINGIPYLGTVEKVVEFQEVVNVVLGIGIPDIKKKIINRLKSNPNLRFPTIIDPSAIVGKDNVKIGQGTVICAGVVITCDITIDEFVTLNLQCTVGHDTKIGRFASFMPSVNISGEVVIEESVYVGTGSKIINQLEIGKQTTVGAGAVVAKSLPPNCTAVGIPAKPIKFHE